MKPGVHDTIRDAVLKRLEMLDAAADAEPSTLLPLARTEINRIAEGWRLLLTVHQRDEEGRCRACPTGIRGRRWPCQVLLAARRAAETARDSEITVRFPPLHAD